MAKMNSPKKTKVLEPGLLIKLVANLIIFRTYICNFYNFELDQLFHNFTVKFAKENVHKEHVQK